MSSHQKLIHDYLNGDLKPDEEKQLFDGLATHPEWRQELSLQMQMQSVAQRDITYVTIPTITTAAIFNRLGFAMPTEAALGSYHTEPTGMLASWGRRIGSLFSRYALTTLWTSAAIATYLVSSQPLTSPVPVMAEQTQSVAATANQQTSGAQTTGAVTSSVQQTASVPDAALKNTSVDSKPLNVGIEDIAGVKNSGSSEPATLQSVLPERPNIPNEPIKEVLDLGKFSTIDYISRNKIIGVAERGKIYASDDGGKTWTRMTTNITADLHGVNFIDSLTGVAVGGRGVLLRTTNGGQSWKIAESGTTAALNTVRFLSKDTAYVCGGDGTILRTTTGGLSWEKQLSGTGVNLYQFHFTDSRTGTVRGDKGTVLQTENAGNTWLKK